MLVNLALTCALSTLSLFFTFCTAERNLNQDEECRNAEKIIEENPRKGMV